MKSSPAMSSHSDEPPVLVPGSVVVPGSVLLSDTLVSSPTVVVVIDVVFEVLVVAVLADEVASSDVDAGSPVSLFVSALDGSDPIDVVNGVVPDASSPG